MNDIKEHQRHQVRGKQKDVVVKTWASQQVLHGLAWPAEWCLVEGLWSVCLEVQGFGSKMAFLFKICESVHIHIHTQGCPDLC